MTKETENYLTTNKLATSDGIRQLKEYLRLDAGIARKKINVMDIDQIVLAVKKHQSENKIEGA